MGYVNKTYLSTQFKNFADKIAKVFSKIGHTHLKSDITDFPTSMPANGGNAATVGGHTVGVNVPSNAKFTDTTYSKLSEFTDDVGYVKNTDARLTNARPASDVYAWAKASSKPSYSWSEITGKPSTFTPASHTHDYLPLSGGTLTGTLNIRFSNGSGYGDWNEGIRIHEFNNWATIALCSSDNTGDTGTSANTWSIHNNKGNFYITKNGSNSSSSAILSCINNSWSINDNAIIHSGNIGSQSVNYASSAGNADTVDGFHASQTAGSKSTCIVTDSNGYINLNYINSNTGNNENPSISQVIVTNGSDNYYRKASLSHLKSSLGSMPASDVYAWAKASSKPSYSWSEITNKPSTFTPASHTHDYLPLSGGTLNGQIHFNDNSLPAFDGSIPYLVGIESFADGGTLKWQSASSVSVGYATSSGNADTVDGHHFNWSGQGGQPTWVWGGNDSSNMYVYNPSNFSVNYANGAGTVKGSYTYNGGQQNPNYFGVNKVGFLMMNTTVNGDDHYKDWIIMDCYSGSDVGGATAIGVDRQEMRAFIMGSDASRTSWTRSAELITTSNISSYAATKDHTHTTATTSLNGFMSSSDKSKLDSIEEGATARTGALTIRMRETDGTLITTFTGKADKTISFNNWEIGTTSGTVCAGNDSRLSDARPASDVYAWAKASTPDGLFEGNTYKGNIDSYAESTLRPGKSYYISTTNISSSSALPFSGYGILTSYAVGSAIVQQIFRYNGSSKIIDAIYTRMYINSGWTSWSKVALTKV